MAQVAIWTLALAKAMYGVEREGPSAPRAYNHAGLVGPHMCLPGKGGALGCAGAGAPNLAALAPAVCIGDVVGTSHAQARRCAGAGTSGARGKGLAAHDRAYGALHAGGPVVEEGASARLVALAGARANGGAAPCAGGPNPLLPTLAGVAVVYSIGGAGSATPSHVGRPVGGGVHASMHLSMDLHKNGVVSAPGAHGMRHLHSRTRAHAHHPVVGNLPIVCRLPGDQGTRLVSAYQHVVQAFVDEDPNT